MKIQSPEEFKQIYNNSIEDKDLYWEEVAKGYHFTKTWDKVSSGDFNDLEIKWFEGAKLNITHNCLDRHLEHKADKTALIFEPNDPNEKTKTYTYKQLHAEVCKFSNILKDQNIKKVDVVCFYMPMIPDLMIGVLACARIGAIHSVVFGGFSAMALRDRINNCKAVMLITADGSMRGEKLIPLKSIADEALLETPTIKKVLVSLAAKNQIIMKEGRDLYISDLLQEASPIADAEIMDAEDPLFILYTSGSTGSPKGLLHTTAGYMVYAGQTFENVFQMGEDDIYWCTADIGWITGHSYITYGPLLNGATTVMFEGVPNSPTPARFWEIVEKHKVTHLYTAPTAIRALMAKDIKYVKQANLDSLKVLGSVGEPINQEAWDWYNENIGNKKCPIVDTWWQTETGGILISALAGVTKTIPTYATHPLPGILPCIMDEKATEIKTKEASGNLCIKTPWPGIARSIFGDHKRYRETYFSTYPGYYFTGDGANRNDQNFYRITGRVDDVMNVSGHRIGTAEVEDAINQHPSIVESAVIGFPHPIKGQGIYAFVIPTDDKYIGNEELMIDLQTKINAIIVKMIGPIAKPDKILATNGLPKTRSGKIMRRILRKIAENKEDELGDTSTLLNPEIVDTIISLRK